MKVHGLLAEFSDADSLLAAANQLREAGYRRLEAYTPFPVEGLAEALGPFKNHIAPITLAGGVIGAAGGYFLQWYSAVVAYPLNVGGRPFHSWPSFIPPTFELAVLGAALFAVVGMLALNGLPKLYDPLFEIPEFEYASRNRFFLYVHRNGAPYGMQATRRRLETFAPKLIKRVRQ